MKKGLCIEVTQGQYDHLYNIMCSQDEIISYLNESDDFDPQTFDNLFDNICNAKETYLSETTKGLWLKQKKKHLLQVDMIQWKNHLHPTENSLLKW